MTRTEIVLYTIANRPLFKQKTVMRHYNNDINNPVYQRDIIILERPNPRESEDSPTLFLRLMLTASHRMYPFPASCFFLSDCLKNAV